MTRSVGLWIDHKNAVIVTVDERGETVCKLESGAQHIVYRGAPRPKTAYSAQYNQGDDQLDKQFLTYLNKYYKKVITLLRGATGILIFGPGEAKVELRSRLEKQKGGSRQVQVERADKMTDRQIVARVRKYFQEAR